MSSTRVWLALVSIMMPRVSGWFDVRRKVLDGLRLAVLQHLEVVLRQVGDQHAVLVLHVEEQVDDVDLGLEGLQRSWSEVALLVLAGGWAGGFCAAR